MPTATTDKLAAKFREMADRLAREIDGKRGTRRENTPRQQRDAISAAIDADHLGRVRTALLKLADAREAGTLPAGLAGIKTKADLLPMLKTRVDCSGGYYSMRDTGEFSDKSAVAVALREWLEESKTAAEVADELVGGTQRAIEEMERLVKFKPIPGFFPTPVDVVVELMLKAGVQGGHLVLEPSAGKGDIAIAARAAGANVICVEVQPVLCDILGSKGRGFTVVGADFLTLDPERYGPFDRVLMNPPFERGQDAEHVRHAFTFLKPGGRLVSVMSSGPFFRSDRKATEFRDWFTSVGGEKHDLPDDAFKDAFRSTGTKTVLVTIDRE